MLTVIYMYFKYNNRYQFQNSEQDSYRRNKKKNPTKIQNHQHNRSNDTMISSKRMDCIGARLNNIKDKMCNWMGAGTVFPT